MNYEIVLPPSMTQELQGHLFSDRTREQMAVMLCGINKSGDRTKFLCRHLIIFPPDAFSHQSVAGLTLKPEVQQMVLQKAAAEGLSQVDWHTHPGNGESIGFSTIDDHYEQDLVRYLHKNIPNTLYASVVTNGRAYAGRVWEVEKDYGKSMPIDRITFGDFQSIHPESSEKSSISQMLSGVVSRAFKKKENDINDEDCERYSRQVKAFGREFQTRLSQSRVGIIGVGGLGSVIVEELTRLGVTNWVIVDPDVIEESNLNRVVAATLKDVKRGRSKVSVARRNIHAINPDAKVTCLDGSVYERRVLKALKGCSLLIVSTDNHGTRFFVNRISAQYLIPLVNVGVSIEVEDSELTDISGEYVIPSLGEWCLECGSVIDNQQAGWDLASPEEQRVLQERGYIKNTPAPAVYHLNATVSSLAVGEIHNVIYPYKPLSRYVVYDALKGELMPITIEPHGDCSTCSPEGVLGLGDLEPFPDIESASTRRGAIPSGRDEQDNVNHVERMEEEKND